MHLSTLSPWPGKVIGQPTRHASPFGAHWTRREHVIALISLQLE